MLLPPCCALYAVLAWVNAVTPASAQFGRVPTAAETRSSNAPASTPAPLAPSRLAHFTARTFVDPTTPQRVAVTFDRSSSQKLLVRAIGRGLPDILHLNTLPTPVLSLQDGARVVAEDRGSAIAPEFTALAHAAGTFPVSRVGRPRFTNLGAALAPTLERGELAWLTSSGDNAAGTILVECHELPATAPAARVRNFSLRGHTGPGDAAMVLGFVVQGEAPLRLLVRALGPALEAGGVAHTVPDPRLAVYSAGAFSPLARNDDWTSTS